MNYVKQNPTNKSIKLDRYYIHKVKQIDNWLFNGTKMENLFSNNTVIRRRLNNICIYSNSMNDIGC